MTGAPVKVRVPFIHGADPAVYPRLLAALCETPHLLAQAEEARRGLASATQPLQALARYAPVAETIRSILGDRAPSTGDAGAIEGARRVLDALCPFEHFLRETGASAKAPLMRPKPRDQKILRALADLASRHLDLFRPAAKWIETVGVFSGDGCRLESPPALLRCPSMRRFFDSALRATEEEEYADAGPAGGPPSERHASPRRVILYLVTIGPGWDAAAAGYARSGNPALALLANALGAGAADTVARDLNDHLDATLLGGEPGRKFRRLSPGYGDWPLEDQRVLVEILDPREDLGVVLNDSEILIPEKSTSGLMAEKRSKNERT
jgi:hypothetical protein